MKIKSMTINSNSTSIKLDIELSVDGFSEAKVARALYRLPHEAELVSPESSM